WARSEESSPRAETRRPAPPPARRRSAESPRRVLLGPELPLELERREQGIHGVGSRNPTGDLATIEIEAWFICLASQEHAVGATDEVFRGLRGVLGEETTGELPQRSFPADHRRQVRARIAAHSPENRLQRADVPAPSGAAHRSARGTTGLGAADGGD